LTAIIIGFVGRRNCFAITHSFFLKGVWIEAGIVKSILRIVKLSTIGEEHEQGEYFIYRMT